MVALTLQAAAASLPKQPDHPHGEIRVTAQTQTTTDITEEAEQLPSRNANGQWLAGSSGNLNGRPKGKKNVITELKQDLEIALRENLTVSDVQDVVAAMLLKALEGNVGAAKLILDKVMSNAREAEDTQDSSGGLKIIIENANLDVLQNTQNVIDVKPTEVEPNE